MLLTLNTPIVKRLVELESNLLRNFHIEHVHRWQTGGVLCSDELLGRALNDRFAGMTLYGSDVRWNIVDVRHRISCGYPLRPSTLRARGLSELESEFRSHSYGFSPTIDISCLIPAW